MYNKSYKLHESIPVELLKIRLEIIGNSITKIQNLVVLIVILLS